MCSDQKNFKNLTLNPKTLFLSYEQKKFMSCNKVLWAENSLKQLLFLTVQTTPGFQISLTFGYAFEALLSLLHIFYIQTHKHKIYTNLHAC